MKGISLKINDRFRNRQVQFFNEISLNLEHASVASPFGFNFYFDPNNFEHKEFACVTHYHEVELFYNDELLIKGNIFNNKFKVSSKKELSSVSGYSLPGVLNDCEIPVSMYPLQNDGLSLRQIAQKLIAPFKIEMIIDSSVSERMNKSFDTSTASEHQTVASYLTELATQKNIVISHDNNGRLLFTESKTSLKPILDFDLTKETPFGNTFEFEVDGQSMHHKITVQKDADPEGGNAGEYTLRNPYVLQSVFRPTVKSQSSGDDIDTQLVARRALSNELRAVKLTITMDRWDIDGKIMRPNNVISIFAPELYIWRKTNFFIESINFTGSSTETIATLNCVLPEVYNNKVPVSIFKGINIHAPNE